MRNIAAIIRRVLLSLAMILGLVICMFTPDIKPPQDIVFGPSLGSFAVPI